MPQQARPSRAPLLALLLATGLTTCAPFEAASSELPESHVATILEGIAEQVEGSVTLPSCPEGMMRVSGSYCPDVEQHCLRWLDPPGKYHEFRCAEYAKDPVCRAPRAVMSYCIDRDEQRLPGVSFDPRPTNDVTWVAAKQACEARGARLCTQSEWQFACEGEEMRPYPYGFVRDERACNIDHVELGRPKALHDLRTPVGGNPQCASPFGVLDLAGNLEEWVTRDPGAGGKATLLKGSWWMPGRSTCRATNAGHDEAYHGTETGFRCCR